MARDRKRGRAAVAFYYNGQRQYRVYPRKDNGRWYADYNENGKRVRVALKATTRPEAEAAVRELDKGPEPVHQETKRKATTLAEAGADFLRHCESRDLAKRSLCRYRFTIDSFGRYCAQNGITQVGQVGLRTLEGFHSFRISKDKVALITAFEDRAILKSFFRFAAHPARRLVENDPTSGWDVRSPVRTEPYCFTPEEVGKLLGGVRTWLRPVLAVLAYSGLRIGELINLRWQDVDVAKGLLHVRAREDWRPKGRRNRTIPMHPLVKRSIPEERPGKYVFMGPKGGKLKQSHCLEALKKDREKLGIRKGTLHTFRHYFVSTCASSGVVPLTTCMSWVGHRDGETVWRYYHLSESASREAMERLGKSGS